MNYSNKLNPHLVNILGEQEFSSTQKFKAINLLNHNRLDVIAKYLYVNAYLTKKNINWVKSLYAEHIRIMTGNHYKENDNTGKNTLDDFYIQFEKLIESMQKDGFNDETSLLPINDENHIIDGAHRLSVAIYLDLIVDTLKVHYLPNSHCYDYDFFIQNNMPLQMLEYIIEQYIRLKKNIYIFCIWPSAKGKDSEIENILKSSGETIYKKNIEFSGSGALLFVAQTYINHPWVGTWKDNFKGAWGQGSGCFAKKGPVRFFLIESDDYNKVVEAKNEIRSLFNIGNFSAHTTDNLDETLTMAKIILNSNSIDFINIAKPNLQLDFNNLFSNYLDTLRTLPESERENFCIDSSAVLASYSIRDVRDLDYITLEIIDPPFNSTLIGNHETNLKYYNQSKDDLILNPNNYYYYLGIKFLTLKNILLMKQKRNELKDNRDIKLSKIFFRSHKVKYYSSIMFQYNSLPKLTLIKLYRNLRLVIRILKDLMKGKITIKEILYKIFINLFKFPITISRNYQGLKIYYSLGTSLVDRIRNSQYGIYEEQTCKMIINYLQEKVNPKFIDIGANIGLISAYVYNNVPNVEIFAFEPGPHQYQLFRKTIIKNNIDNSIKLTNIALSNTNSIMEFHVHKTQDASGDGFFDTRRAGNTKTINVAVQKLDDWWNKNNQPHIDIIKIDTEGAELWVLEGSIELLKNCKPEIITEICDLNYKNYPYSENEVIKFFISNNYSVYTEEGNLVTINNIKNFQHNKIYTYLCKPN